MFRSRVVPSQPSAGQGAEPGTRRQAADSEGSLREAVTRRLVRDSRTRPGWEPKVADPMKEGQPSFGERVRAKCAVTNKMDGRKTCRPLSPVFRYSNFD